MIEVYHNTQFLEYMFKPTNESLKKGTFNYTATVETDSLDKAFKYTNHIDSDWTHNKEVKAVSLSCRSTSVGDLFKLNSVCFIVESSGFRELSREEESELTFFIPL